MITNADRGDAGHRQPHRRGAVAHGIPVPYTSAAIPRRPTLPTIHITNIGSENECQTAYFVIPVVPVSSVAIAVTCEPFAGKK